MPIVDRRVPVIGKIGDEILGKTQVPPIQLPPEKIIAGGNGKDGSILVNSSKENTTIELRGEKGWLLLKNVNNQATVYLEGDTGKIVAGGIRINDKDLLLRRDNDPNHGIGWYGTGKLFAGTNLDGPAVFGFSGGALGTTKNGQKIALQWDSDGKIGIGTTSPSAKLEVNGDIKVTGDVFLTGGADCAEEFDVAGAESVEPGTVMVIDRDGALRPSEQAYDKRVAGVISGAGGLRPGITLDKQNNKTNRLPLALTGKVYCKIDTQYGSVELGDLLTSSPTCGHAMKADDPFKAFGSVIGKALRPMETGRGMIPILIALQ